MSNRASIIARGLSCGACIGPLLGALAGCSSDGFEVGGDEPTVNEQELGARQLTSLKYERLLEVRAGATTERLVSGQKTDTLEEYAAKCAIATGLQVPAFNCTVGEEPGGQGTTPRGTSCATPNVLNGVCDPGSRFQVLASNADATIVGHCRKDGLAATGGAFNDIAIIQYNKKNGAECFYQALGYGSGPLNGALDGANVRPPSEGSSAWPWLSPQETEAINCTGCHNNGGFIRSPYLAQLAALPNTSTGYSNLSTPVGYVGTDFGLNRSWSMSTTKATGDTGLNCNSCHRVAVSNYLGFGMINGSGAHLALVATAASQASKFPHGPLTSTTSPIWMRPGQTTYNAGAEATAMKYDNCAQGFWANQTQGFQTGTATAGCTFTALAVPFTGFSPAQLVSTLF